MRTIFSVFCLLAAASGVPAAEGERPAYRHSLSGGPSVGKIVSGDGPRSSSVGLDYLYRLNPKWEIGVQLDFNYGRGFSGFESTAIVPIVSYEVADRLPMFVGAGVEHRRESGVDEFVARAGFEYVIPLDDNQRFALLPGGFIDFVDGEVIASAVVAVGFSF